MGDSNLESIESKPVPFHQLITLGAIQGYKLFISPSKGSQCPSNPSCSTYGFTAFQTHDPLTAYLMTADRLHRCGHDLGNYEVEEIDGVYRFIDSVDYKGKPYKEQSVVLLNQFGYIPSNDFNPDTLLKTEEGRLFAFANSLADKQDYILAETEYKRFISYFPSSKYFQKVQKALLYSLYRNGKFLEGINLITEDISASYSETDYEDLQFLLAICYFKVENYPLSENIFLKLADSKNYLIRDKSFIMLGIISAKNLDWKMAENYFLKITHPLFISKAKEFALVASDGQKLNHKDPLLAGFLSIVPGLGYFYSGYNQTGFSSFIVNSIFFLATYQAFKSDNNSLGAILGFISFGWYTGNIYGSYVSSERKNEYDINSLNMKFSINFH